jgi:hypothetical protein
MKNRVLGLGCLEDMNHTPYRKIAVLPQKAHSASVNEFNANASIINLSMLKVGSKTFTQKAISKFAVHLGRRRKKF